MNRANVSTTRCDPHLHESCTSFHQNREPTTVTPCLMQQVNCFHF
uniref:Uncharacterized protein n=1 Tax=Arundo donax TaxID=35708 RepID=A0A0A8ZJF7_ARUDO